MINRKTLVAFLLAFCVSSIMFFTLPIRSQTTPSYDPWADVSGPIVGQPDGIINMRDVAYEIAHFNTNGIPIDRTDPLGQQSQIDKLNSSIQELQARVDPVEFSNSNVTTLDFRFQGQNGPPIIDVVQAANFTWIPRSAATGNPYKLVRIFAYFEYMIENANASYMYLFNPWITFNNSTVIPYSADDLGGPTQFISVPGLVETPLNSAENYTITFNAYGYISGNPSASEVATMHIILKNIHILIFDLY